MSFLKSYKRLGNLIRNESFEPLISWGFRMGLAGTIPVLWGIYTSHISDSIWVALTAEAVSWVEMKGSFTWRVRTLLAAAVFAILFSFAGCITGGNVWLSVIAMLLVGFFATLLKNIGDRASGLAVCVYLMFILSSAYPEASFGAIKHRLLLVSIGAAWPVLVGVVVSLLMPAEEPYRRQIALIWRAVSGLAGTLSAYTTGGDISKVRATVYDKEKDVRTAIDNSYQFYGRMAYQVSSKDNLQYQLAMVRKAAGLVGVSIIAIGEEMENVAAMDNNKKLLLNLNTLFGALTEAATRISVFIITLKPEEKLLAITQISRMQNLLLLIRRSMGTEPVNNKHPVQKVLNYTERTAKLLESVMQRIEQMGTDTPVFRSYSLIKTSFILKPQYLLRNTRELFNLTTFTSRYAIRSAIAAGVAMLLYKWFDINHGYWLPFSVMIIKQPYFGATITRAKQRVLGTVLGVIAGSLLLKTPAGLHLKEIILFATFVLMVYYLRKNYAAAAFFVTINLVLLFNLESTYNEAVLVSRVLCTLGGAALAVGSSFALLPTWDKKWLTKHLAEAINCNYEYFKATFFAPARPLNWTRNKRSVETRNSNMFDSFNRYLEEPGKKKSQLYYDVLTCNVRVTRNLNNIHLEQDEKKQLPAEADAGTTQARLEDCLIWFNKIMHQVPEIYPALQPEILEPGNHLPPSFYLSEAQLTSLEKMIIELKTMDIALHKLHQ